MRTRQPHAKRPHKECWRDGPPIEGPAGIWRDARGHRICGCGSRRNPTGHCHSDKLTQQNARCRMHGGKAAIGAAAGPYKHGGYSKILPKGLRERWEAHLADPNLVDHREDIAFVKVAVELMFDGGNPALLSERWRLETARVDAILQALRSPRPGQTTALPMLEAHQREMHAGLQAVEQWDAIAGLIDLKRRLSEAQTKQERDRHQMIPLAQAWLLIAALYDAVKRHVPEGVALAAIGREFLRLTAGGVGPALDPGEPGRDAG